MVVGDEVEQVYVAAGHRGSGVAAVLLAEAARRVAANGHRRVAAGTHDRAARGRYPLVSGGPGCCAGAKDRAAVQPRRRAEGRTP
jgi:GNAT superfamily N-acetyltransferase